MSDADDLIGRYAKLVNCDDKAELNGTHVAIRAFSSVDDTYEVESEGRTVNNIKLSQIQLYTPTSFTTRFPNARVVTGDGSMKEAPVGAVIDFSNRLKSLQVDSPTIETFTVRGSCRIIGTPNSLYSEQTIRKDLHLAASENDIIEIYSGTFDEEFNVDCVRGHIVFRLCLFRSTRCGVTVCAEPGYPDSVRVTFESCTFSGMREWGVSVDCGHVEIINCAFIDCGMAVVVKSSGHLRIHHATFETSTGGVVVPNHGTVDMYRCHFTKMVDFGLLMSNNSSVRIDKCQVDTCSGDGIVVEGNSYATQKISNCTINQCRAGVRVGNGKINVDVDNMRITNCKIGVYIQPDAIGHVSIKDCNALRSDTDFMFLQGDKCVVKVNGTRQEDGQRESLVFNRSVIESTGIKYGYPVSGTSKQMLLEAGVTGELVRCTGCQRQPSGTIFKKCGKCKEARYCSRDCQQAHWRTHVVECRVTQLRATMLCHDGYVTCNSCGVVEAQCKREKHNACSRCLKTIYCSKKCLKNVWPVHKDKCVPYKF